MSTHTYDSCKSTNKNVEVSRLVTRENITVDLECNYEQSNPLNKTFNATINWKESQIVVYYLYRRAIYVEGLNFN